MVHSAPAVRRHIPLGALALLALALCACGADGEDGSPRAAASLAQDARIAPLLADCRRLGIYDVDTSDTVGIQLELLLRGQLEPLRRARSELAASAAAPDEVRRLMERTWADPDGANFLRNALDVISLSDWPQARGLLLRALGHPSPSVRRSALLGMQKHGLPEDYDVVLGLVDFDDPEIWGVVSPLLHDLDPARAEPLYVGWFRELSMHSRNWNVLGGRLAGSSRPETVELCRELLEEAGPVLRPYVVVVVAGAGDETALAELREVLREEDDPGLRRIWVHAAALAGLHDELAFTAQQDADATVRALAIGAIAEGEFDEDLRALLLGGTSDPNPDVRRACLTELARHGDPAALDLALSMLSDRATGSLQSGVAILKSSWDADPVLAGRALERLLERDAEDAHRPPSERARTLHAIGLVPDERAARYLVQVARESEGTIQNQRAHRWLVLRAGNAGQPGWEVLLEAYGEESDALRRLDLLEALSAMGGERAREALLELAADGSAPPLEILYMADRLVRMGPAARVAPLLKRISRRVEDAPVRAALQCVLWAWYPEPTWRAG